MKKLMLSLVGALGLSVSINSWAAGFDVNDMTCGHFMEIAEESEEVAGVLIFWLDGYLSGVTGDTRFDSEIIESLASEIDSACEKSPDSKLIEIAKIVGTD